MGLTQERDGAVLVMRLDTGPTGLLTAKLCAAIAEAFKAAIADDGVRAIVFTGAAPDVFIRHYDVASIVRAATALKEGRSRPEDYPNSIVFRAFDLVANCPKPVIAAINGVCMGGGFEFALCCTMRVAQTGVAQIGLPETRIGIFPGSGGTQRLPRLIGEARALSFILGGEVVDATEALRLGLVDHVADDALARALDLARVLSSHSRQLLTTVLKLVRAAHGRPVSEGVREESIAFAALLRDDPEAAAAMQTFLDSGEGLGSYNKNPAARRN